MHYLCKRIGFLALFLGFPSWAWAHALNVSCALKDGRLEVKALFDTGEPAEGAKVQIMDDDRQLLSEGQSDAKGQCSLPAPPPGNFRVIVDDGAGHRQVVHITERTIITDVAPRDNFWLKVILGLGVIGALALGALVALRRNKTPPARDVT